MSSEQPAEHLARMTTVSMIVKQSTTTKSRHCSMPFVLILESLIPNSVGSYDTQVSPRLRCASNLVSKERSDDEWCDDETYKNTAPQEFYRPTAIVNYV